MGGCIRPRNKHRDDRSCGSRVSGEVLGDGRLGNEKERRRGRGSGHQHPRSSFVSPLSSRVSFLSSSSLSFVKTGYDRYIREIDFIRKWVRFFLLHSVCKPVTESDYRISILTPEYV